MRKYHSRSDNKSGITGVCWHPRAGKWRAQIFHNGRQNYLGLYRSKLTAAHVRLQAEKNFDLEQNDDPKSAKDYIENNQ